MKTADEIDVLECKLAGLETELRRARETMRDGYFRSALTGLLAHGYGPRDRVVQKAWYIADESLKQRRTEMSTFSSDIGPEEEDGAGWGGLVPTAEERRAEKREAQDKIDRETGAAWRINSSLEVWFPFTAEELVKLRQDKDRLEWILPIVTGVDSDNADWKTMAIAEALMAGLDGRDAIDRAMKSA